MQNIARSLHDHKQTFTVDKKKQKQHKTQRNNATLDYHLTKPLHHYTHTDVYINKFLIFIKKKVNSLQPIISQVLFCFLLKSFFISNKRRKKK